MPFSNTDDGLPIRSHAAIGVSQAAGRGRLRTNCQRFCPGFLPIQTLILKIGKKDCVIVNEIRAAPIFVRAGARVECLRDRVSCFSIQRIANDSDASAFIGTALEPVHLAIRKAKFAETNAR